MARELAAAESAAVYGRIGTTTQEFGTLASWLVDVLNVLTGNLDRPGGALFPRAAAGQRNSSGEPGRGRGVKIGRWHSRVRGLPGELRRAAGGGARRGDRDARRRRRPRADHARRQPGALDAELRAARARARQTLDLYVAIDIYVNETTRHADVILPAPSPLQRSHYDLALYQLAVRNVVNYSPPVLPPDPGLPDEWVTLLRLAAVAAGQPVPDDVEPFDRLVAGELIRRDVADPHSPLHGRDVDELLAEVEPRRGPERLLDLLLRAGPYDLTLADLEAAPHGIDLGPLEPRLPDVLRTPSGMIELAPPPIVADVGAAAGVARRASTTAGSCWSAAASCARTTRGCTTSSCWSAARSAARCTSIPTTPPGSGSTTARRRAWRTARARWRRPVEVTDAVMPGVVSLPHGWGHDAPGARLGVAGAHAGVNANLLADEALVDALSGNAVLNGIPVVVAPVAAAVPA